MELSSMTYEGKEPYIFISYSHQDDQTVLPIAEKLCQRYFRLWYDAGIDLGSDWADNIASHLSGSACVLAFFSKNYLASKFCQKELKYTLRRDKPLIVIYLEDVQLSEGLEMQLDDIQAFIRKQDTNDELLTMALCESQLLQPCLIQRAVTEQSAAADDAAADEYLSQADALYYENNLAEAFRLYLRAAELGNAEAELAVGESYLHGEGVVKDPKLAVGWFHRACQKGLPQAHLALGDCYAFGLGVPKNEDEAVVYYRFAADQGIAEAQYALGSYYFNGQNEKKNIISAIFWYHQAAQQNHPDAQYILGQCYYKGFGVVKNKAEALDWYRKAAKNGCAEAKLIVEHIEFSAIEKASSQADSQEPIEAIIEKPSEKAQELYRQANALYAGEHGDPDYSKAVEYYRLAAALGLSDAQLSLGVCYERGRGVPYDKAMAAHWYRQAAENGNVKAQYKMAVCFCFGEGVARNLTESAYWYQKAAEQGHMQAQFKLAQFYENGTGVPQNLNEAEFWYRKSLDSGYNLAEYHIRKLSKRKES